MTRDIRDGLTDLIQRAVEQAIVDPEGAAARVDRIVPPAAVPALEGWPTPSRDARKRGQMVVCHAVSAIEALSPQVRGDVVYTELAELPNVGYEFKPCTDREDLALAPLLTHCLSARAGLHLAVLTSYRFSPVIARHKTDFYEVDLFASDVRASLARRANSLALLESHLWFIATLGDPEIIPPYAVRFDLARYTWDRNQPGHILCLRCAAHVHYRRKPRPGTPRDGRCRPCSRGRPNTWPTHAIEPDRRGTWWLHCQTPGCSTAFTGRADQLRCPHCRLDTTTRSKRTPLPQ
jgi:hypothetical protein